MIFKEVRNNCFSSNMMYQILTYLCEFADTLYWNFFNNENFFIRKFSFYWFLDFLTASATDNSIKGLCNVFRILTFANIILVNWIFVQDLITSRRLKHAQNRYFSLIREGGRKDFAKVIAEMNENGFISRSNFKVTYPNLRFTTGKQNRRDSVSSSCMIPV